MSRRHKVAAALMALAIVGAACGGDDDDSGNGGSGGGDGELSLDDPVSIIMLAETTGESEAAVPFYDDGASMAVDDLNEAGGIGGEEVEYERISTPLEGAEAESAFLEAVEEEPTAILGLPSSGQVLAAAQRVGEAQIPVLYEATATQALVGAPDSVANDYGFLVRPPQDEISAGIVRFAVESLEAESVGLVCANNPFGETGCDIAEEAADELGVAVAGRETVEQDTTDFSGAVLELRDAGADAVVSYIFPNAVAALHNALAENDLDVPHVSGSASLIAATGAITSGNMDNFYGIDDCSPAASDDPEVQEWAQRFEDEHGYAPNYGVAESYDAVMMVAEAVEAAGSTDPDAIRDALAEIEYEGVCTTYRGEPSQGLHHQLVGVSFDEEGQPAIEETYELDDYEF
ncbi:MAG TPA: ABC transporter substrate-binding protein [Acidimicrobiales bacterium]